MLKDLHQELIHLTPSCMPPYHPRWKFDFGENIVIVLQVVSKKINSILEDMMRANNISQQMLKNPLVNDNNKKNV
jgi:hypothetical protein